jgi:hypothetical protein
MAVQANPHFLQFLNSIDFGPRYPTHVAKGRDSVPLITLIPKALNGSMDLRSADLLMEIYIHVNNLWFPDRSFKPDLALEIFIRRTCNTCPLLKTLISYDRIPFCYMRTIIRLNVQEIPSDDIYEEYNILKRCRHGWEQLQHKNNDGLLSYEARTRLYNTKFQLNTLTKRAR